jgi:hypothetical protein
LVGSLAASASAWLLLLASEAAARGQGERIGENLGGLLGGWARSLYVGIVAVVALVFLLNRRFADLAVFIVASVVVGGFVFAPDSIATTVQDIWKTITA